ncbi:MAG: hypothetical protein SGPRY_001425 [Prymnesium sp.]
MAATTASGAAECCPVIEFPSSSPLLRSQWPDLYAGIWVRQRTALNGFVEYYNRQNGLSLRKEIPPLNTAPVALQQQVQARWIIVSGCAAGVRCPWNLAPFGSISYGQLLMYMEDVQSTSSRNYFAWLCTIFFHAIVLRAHFAFIIITTAINLLPFAKAFPALNFGLPPASACKVKVLKDYIAFPDFTPPYNSTQCNENGFFRTSSDATAVTWWGLLLNAPALVYSVDTCGEPNVAHNAAGACQSSGLVQIACNGDRSAASNPCLDGALTNRLAAVTFETDGTSQYYSSLGASSANHDAIFLAAANFAIATAFHVCIPNGATIFSDPCIIYERVAKDCMGACDQYEFAELLAHNSTWAWEALTITSEIVLVGVGLVPSTIRLVNAIDGSRRKMQEFPQGPLFTVASGKTLILSNLIIEGVMGSSPCGGAVRLESGGRLKAQRVTFKGNQAEEGGAICCEGWCGLDLRVVTFSDNTAARGADIKLPLLFGSPPSYAQTPSEDDYFSRPPDVICNPYELEDSRGRMVVVAEDCECAADSTVPGEHIISVSPVLLDIKAEKSSSRNDPRDTRLSTNFRRMLTFTFAGEGSSDAFGRARQYQWVIQAGTAPNAVLPWTTKASTETSFSSLDDGLSRGLRMLDGGGKQSALCEGDREANITATSAQLCPILKDPDGSSCTVFDDGQVDIRDIGGLQETSAQVLRVGLTAGAVESAQEFEIPVTISAAGLRESGPYPYTFFFTISANMEQGLRHFQALLISSSFLLPAH